MEINPPLSPPKPNQVEVVLFGPGHGECILVHLGNLTWIVVDSCVDIESGEPVALKYLRSIGQDPGEMVKLIVATHWHDDHIRGLSQLLEKCPKAKFCCSTAMGKEEFVATVSKYYEPQPILKVRSGVNEIYKIQRILADEQEAPREAIKATPNRPIFTLQNAKSAKNGICRVFSLSPSDKQIDLFFKEIASMMPKVNTTKKVVSAQNPNHLSVVLWVQVDQLSILLGADLQETTDPSTGWSVIVSSGDRPGGQASIFKIPHHGSENGHNGNVWSTMLAKNPIGILSPNNPGGFIPGAKDISRIKQHTSYLLSSSVPRTSPSKVKRHPAVEKTIRENNYKIRKVPIPGAVRLRNSGNSDEAIWSVDLIPPACQL